MKSSLRSRLDRLEYGAQGIREQTAERARALENAILSETLRHLTTDELRVMEAVIPAITQRNPLTPEEKAAFEAFSAAAEEACRHAGFSSLAEFYRRCKA